MRPDVIQQACVLLHFGVPRDAALRKLTQEERALFDDVDARAFRTDPERRFRMIAAVLEEYPVSCAVVGVNALEKFFESAQFLDVIESRAPLGIAFGDWIDAGDVAALERAIARARRRRVAAVTVSEGTLDHWSLARASVTPETIARGARIARAVERTEREHLLIEGEHITRVSEALCLLVQFGERPRARAELVERARALGAGEDAEDVVDDLLKDGLLSVAS